MRRIRFKVGITMPKMNREKNIFHIHIFKTKKIHMKKVFLHHSCMKRRKENDIRLFIGWKERIKMLFMSKERIVNS